jgi:hypothetical protein
MATSSHLQRISKNYLSLEEFDDIQILIESRSNNGNDSECREPMSPKALAIFKTPESRETWDCEINRAQPLCLVFCTDEDYELENESIPDYHVIEEEGQILGNRRPSLAPRTVLTDVSNTIINARNSLVMRPLSDSLQGDYTL